MKINRNRYSHNFKSTIFIDFQYQSINCYWLLLIIIDFIDYRKPLIDNAGFIYELQNSTTIAFSRTHSTLSTPENPPVEFPHAFGFQIVNTPPCPQNSIIVNPPSPSEIQKAVRGIVWIFSGIAHYRMLMSIAWWDETRKILETTTNWVLSSRNKHFLHLPLEWILRHDLFLKKNKNNHSQTQQTAKPRALACTCPYAKLIKKDHRKVFYLKVWYFCSKSNFWTIKTVFILVKVCIYVLYTRQCQGYCPMGAWSPEAPTIYLWATKIWNKRPERVHENHDPQDNFH